MDRWIKYRDLQLDLVLGQGNYGAVSKGIYKATPVAVKELYPGDPELAKYFQREVSMLSAARHPNIVEFIGISRNDEGNFLIITEFCDLLGDLRQVLKKDEIDWKKELN